MVLARRAWFKAAQAPWRQRPPRTRNADVLPHGLMACTEATHPALYREAMPLRGN